MRNGAVVILAMLLVACASASKTPPPRQLATELELETVALVRTNEENKPVMYCAGVFVSPTTVLTASHCVVWLGLTPEQILTHMLGLADDDEKPNPIGKQALFSTQLDYPAGRHWTSIVIGYDRDTDLGALRIDASGLTHPYARLGLGDIYAGDKVEVVGHPGGYTWSYVEGVVSSVRMKEPNGHGTEMATIQVNGAFSHGNSGGGLFNASGELIGIASYIDGNTNGMGFFVHRDAIRTFLSKLPR